MAEIQQQAAGPPKAGKRRAKKMSTRIDMVAILDEMNITHQKKYALVNITQDDLTLLNSAAL